MKIGILTQANNSKIEQSNGAVKEGISLAYNEYQILKKTADNEIDKSNFLNFLVAKGYVDTTEIEGEKIIKVETLTGSKQALGNGKDTDIYVISLKNGDYILNYIDNENNKQEIWKTASVEINVNVINLPNEERPTMSVLIVDSIVIDGEITENLVERIEKEAYLEILKEKISLKSIKEKVDLLYGAMKAYLEEVAGNEQIPENWDEEYDKLFCQIFQCNSKEEVYQKLEDYSNEESDSLNEQIAAYAIIGDYNVEGSYDMYTYEYLKYIITNQDNEVSNYYIANKNGEYTFKVEIDGIEYSKTISINNLTNNEETNKYEVNKISFDVGLKDLETNNFTNFSNAYIIINGKLEDISNLIKTENGISKITESDLDVKFGLEGISSIPLNLILVKDDKCYYGEVAINTPR